MKFYGKTIDGQLFITGDLKNYLKSLNGDFEIKVTKTKDIRTLEMNNLYWWWMTLLSEESGYTKSELHNYFKTKLLCEIEEGVNKESVINCKSTADLNVKEFSHYLQEVGRIAAENFSYYLPDRFP